MKTPSRYKITFLDRHGPAGALRLKAGMYGITVFGLSLPMFGLLGARIGLSGLAAIAFTLVAALTLSALAMFFGLRGGQAAGDFMRYLTSGGSSTPYEEQFSQEQALVMQRDHAAALALYEQRIAAAPGDPRARIAAADLYATQGANPKRAAELYREVQRAPSVAPGHDIYVSNKLADLYLGPLGEPRRALVEFRRLIERYPGTTAATHAKLALANLKEDMIQDHESS
jgi:hypothetical protein